MKILFRKIAQMSSLAISMFETSMEALYGRNFDLSKSSSRRLKDVLTLEKKAISTCQNAGAKEAASLRLIIENVRRTTEYAADIAEIVLNLTVDSVLIQRSQRK
jgi:phosphate uptake regulator